LQDGRGTLTISSHRFYTSSDTCDARSCLFCVWIIPDC
jgi:hypothetical protein